VASGVSPENARLHDASITEEQGLRNLAEFFRGINDETSDRIEGLQRELEARKENHGE
jgi:hypothetical protein